MIRGGRRRHVTIFLAAHVVSQLSETMLVGDSPELQREMLKRARELVRLLERGTLKGRRRLHGDEDVIDLDQRRRCRDIGAALGITAPDSKPPPRAA